MNFKDKVVVITGAGNGIGRETALQLLNKGAKVVALDISEDGLKETKTLAKEYASNLLIQELDVTMKAEVEKLPEMVIHHFGKIDAVLNVAGVIQPFVKVNELTYDKIERVMNINFYGTLYMVKAFLPHLLNSKETALIGNVSSMGGFLPVPGQAVYGASKAAVKLLTEALYAELRGTNVKVSIVFPGGVATNITQNSNPEAKAPVAVSDKKQKAYKMLSVEKATQIMIDGLEKEKFRIIVGSDSRFMDSIYRLNPKRAVHFISDKMKDLLK